MLLAVTTGLMVAAASCSSDRPDETATAPGEDGVIEIRLTSSLRFEPSDVVVAPGTTVRWRNDAAVFHTVTPNDAAQPGVWTRRTMTAGGESFTHTFTEAGQVYDYHCEPHLGLGMTGRVRVE